MSHKHTLAIGLFVTTGLCPAQITEVNTSSEPTIQLLRSLPSAGPKLITGSASGFTILNTDLTSYMSVVYPTGLGYTVGGYGAYGGIPLYVTETLFDDDASTIEYMVFANIGGSPHGSTIILRTDGTLLLAAAEQSIMWPSTPDHILDSPPIYNTPGGTFMKLSESGSGATHFYALPGTLPCIGCDGGISAYIVGEEENRVDALSSLTAFPNPSSGEITVRYTLATGTERPRIVVMDVRGGEVLNVPASLTGETRVPMTGLSEASYLVQLRSENGRIGTTRMVVVK